MDAVDRGATSRVEWSRRTPDEVETVLAIMLCIEQPDAYRIKPGQGDGGIDVLAPGEAGATVYQIKSFTGALNASRKGQIERSLRRFLETVEQEGMDVREWVLMRPEDPTPADIQWLAELTGDLPFTCRWQGLAHCDGLAARHPEVIDYYFGNGSARVLDMVRGILSGVDASATTHDVVQERLSSLRNALNAADPHFRYDFAIGEVIDGELPDFGIQPGMAFAVTRSAGDQAVTFWGYPKYRQAVVDSPLIGSFTVDAVDMEAAMDFHTFGVPLEGVRVSNVNLGLPSGLGVESGVGVVTLAVGDAATITPMDVCVRSPEGDALATAALDKAQVFRGSGTSGGGSLRATAFDGFVDIGFKIDFANNKMTMVCSHEDPTGHAPAQIVAAIDFLSALAPPNLFSLVMRDGPDLTELMPIPFEVAPGISTAREVYAALATIQKHTLVRILVPDPASVPIEVASDWLTAAKLLRGDTVTFTWKAMTFTEFIPTDGSTANTWTESDPVAMKLSIPLKVNINGTPIVVGQQSLYLRSAKVAEASADSGLKLVAGDDDTGYAILEMTPAT